MNKTYNLYIDMDEVLVDFKKGYKDLTGIDLTTFKNNSSFWDPINKAGYDFWINLQWEKDGKELWNYVKKYNPEILSAPSKSNDSRIGKHDWVKKELPGVKLNLRSAEYKKDFASPNSILVDDRIENINDWKESGGIGIHHKNTNDTIKQLKKLGL